MGIRDWWDRVSVDGWRPWKSDDDSFMVRRSVYEAAQKLESGQAAGIVANAEAHAFSRASAGARARDNNFADFWNSVGIYLQEKAAYAGRSPFIIEDAGKGWPPPENPVVQAGDGEVLDFGGGESDEDMRARWAKQTEGVRGWLDEQEKKKGGGPG
jgi:hypothetical protein